MKKSKSSLAFVALFVVILMTSFGLPTVSNTHEIGTTNSEMSQVETKHIDVSSIKQEPRSLIENGGAKALAENMDPPPHRMGLIFEDPEKSEILIPASSIQDSSSPSKTPHPGDPPESIFNYEALPPVGDQGAQGSCVAWAAAYYSLTHQVARENDYWDTSKPHHQFSPAFMYNQINSGEDSGSYFSDAFELLEEFGCGTMADMSYSDSDLNTWPTSEIYDNAMRYRTIESYYSYVRDDTGINNLKLYLADGNTAVIGIIVRTPFYSFDQTTNVYTTAHASEPYQGGHGVCVVGYDDTKATSDGPGAFRVVNSWGTDWGDSGFFWISYEAMKNSNLVQSYFYYFDLYEQPYQPQLTASLRLTHEHRGQFMFAGVTVRLRIDGLTYWSRNYWDYYMGTDDGTYQNSPFPDTPISIDLTDAIPSLATATTNEFCLEIRDSVWTEAGRVESFSVYYDTWNSGGVSTDTPVDVPDDNTQADAVATLDKPRVSINTMPTYVAGVQSIGVDATGESASIVAESGFEQGMQPNVWWTFDDNPSDGYVSWGVSRFRSLSGGYSAWCGGIPSSTTIYAETFGMALWYWPLGWSLYSTGTNSNPWTYTGSPGAYAIYCDTGGMADVVEWAVYGPIDVTGSTDLFLEFFMDYEVVNAGAGQKARVLYSTDGSSFYFLETWEAPVGDTVSYESNQLVPIPDSAISSTFYFAFIFEGDYTGSLTIDDIYLRNVVAQYSNYQDSYLARPVNLDGYQSAKLAFDYWADLETGFDWFSPVYHTDSGWIAPYQLGSSTGWQSYEISIPTETDYVGFFFHSDISVVREGVYIDNVRVVGENWMTQTEVRVDGSLVATFPGAGSWNAQWNSCEWIDGEHVIQASATFQAQALTDQVEVTVDNTNPLLRSTTEDYQNGNNITLSGYANALEGSQIVSLMYGEGNMSQFFGASGYSEYVNSTTIYWEIYNVSVIVDGYYEQWLNLSDAAGNYHAILVRVTVDNTPPEATAPGSVTVSEGATGEFVSWSCHDANPSSYVLYVDGVLYDEGSWTESLSWPTGDFEIGIYNFTLVIEDAAGNSQSSTVMLEVLDDTPPTLTSPEDIIFVEGTVGNAITWSAKDRHPGTVTVLHNGSLYLQASWTDDVILSLDSLPWGAHNMTIVVEDTSGNIVQDTVMVTVQDVTSPTLSSPEDIAYVEGSDGNVIQWSAHDRNPRYFALFRNDEILSTGMWISRSQTWEISVDGLTAATYNYTFIVYDMAGNSAVDQVDVQVNPQSTTSTTTTSTTTSTSTTTQTGTGPTETSTPPSELTADNTLLVILAIGIGGILAVVAVIIVLRRRT